MPLDKIDDMTVADGLHRFQIGGITHAQKLFDLIDESGAEHQVDEVKKLLGMGYSADLKSMQSIGYRHIAAFIEGSLSWDECVRTLKRDTSRFAKRQFTWFGADQQIQWCEPDQVNGVVRLVKKFLE